MASQKNVLVKKLVVKAVTINIKYIIKMLLMPSRVHNIYREESIQLSIFSLNTLCQVVT